jgi:hypothetical protein
VILKPFICSGDASGGIWNVYIGGIRKRNEETQLEVTFLFLASSFPNWSHLPLSKQKQRSRHYSAPWLLDYTIWWVGPRREEMAKCVSFRFWLCEKQVQSHSFRLQFFLW